MSEIQRQECEFCFKVHDVDVECWEKSVFLEEQAKLDVCPKAVDGVHQYFEIKKLLNAGYEKKGRDDYTRFEKAGLLVKCALCKQSQELWEE
jgi:hypothetical protein